MSDFGKNLQLAREAAGMSRDAVARTIGKSPSSVRAYERGTVMPPFPVVTEMAWMYGVSLDELARGL